MAVPFLGGVWRAAVGFLALAALLGLAGAGPANADNIQGAVFA